MIDKPRPHNVQNLDNVQLSPEAQAELDKLNIQDPTRMYARNLDNNQPDLVASKQLFKEVELAVDRSEKVEVPGIADIALNESMLKQCDVVAILSKDLDARKAVLVIRGSEKDRAEIKTILKKYIDMGQVIDSGTLVHILEEETVAATYEPDGTKRKGGSFMPESRFQIMVISKPNGTETDDTYAPNISVIGAGKPDFSGFQVTNTGKPNAVYSPLSTADSAFQQGYAQQPEEYNSNRIYISAISAGNADSFVISTGDVSSLSSSSNISGTQDVAAAIGSSYLDRFAVGHWDVRQTAATAAKLLKDRRGDSVEPPVMVIKNNVMPKPKNQT